MNQPESRVAMLRRVLVCGAESSTAFSVVSCIRLHWGSEVHVVTADSNPAERVTPSLLADRHFQTPALGDPAFPAAVSDILLRERITDYILLHDSEFDTADPLQARHPDVAIWTSPILRRLGTDKLAAHHWLAALGLPVPVLHSAASLPAAGEVFVKPRRGYGGRGASRRPVEAVRLLPEELREPLIVQEILAEPEISVDSFHDAATGAHRAVVRERLKVKSGICTVARLRDDPVLAGYALTIGRALGQRGTICFQAMRSADGWAITDLNLRPGAGTSMSAAAGVDLLAAMIACRFGLPYAHWIERPLPAGGVHVTRQFTDFLMA